MPKYNVHVFDLFRVRVENVEADSQEKAIEAVTGDTGLYDPRDFIPTKETGIPEGATGVSYIEPSDDGPAYYLVDEVGDEEHTKTKWHPGMFDLDLNEAAPDMLKALDEADTAFAVINICDNLTPQARGALKEAWRMVQDTLAKAKPGSAYVEAVKEVRTEEAAQAESEDMVRVIVIVHGGVAHTAYSNLKEGEILVSVLDRDNQDVEEDVEEQKYLKGLEEEIKTLNEVY